MLNRLTAALLLLLAFVCVPTAYAQDSGDRNEVIHALHQEMRDIEGVHIEIVDGRPTLCGHVMRVEDRRKIDSILLRYPSAIDAVSSAIVNRDEALLEALKAELAAYPTLNITQNENSVLIAGKVYSRRALEHVRSTAGVYYPNFREKIEVEIPNISVRMSLFKVRSDLRFKDPALDAFVKQAPSPAMPVRKFTFERLTHDRIITNLVDSGCCTLIYTRAFTTPAGRPVAVSANRQNWGDLVFRLDIQPYESGVINSEVAAFVSTNPRGPRYYKKFGTVTAPLASVAAAGLLPVFAGAKEIDISGLPSFRPFFQQGKMLKNTEMLVVYSPAIENK